MKAVDEACVRAALSDVFDGWAVTSLRADSPLASVGMRPADSICVAIALHSHAGILLTDDDFAGLVTLGDLCALVQERSTRTEAL